MNWPFSRFRLVPLPPGGLCLNPRMTRQNIQPAQHDNCGASQRHGVCGFIKNQEAEQQAE